MVNEGGGSLSQPKIQHSQARDPSSVSVITSTEQLHQPPPLPLPNPSPPPFSTLQLQSKPVPGSERSVIEFLVSSCRVLLWALPVSNKFQSVNSPLTLAHFILRIPLRSYSHPIRTCVDLGQRRLILPVSLIHRLNGPRLLPRRHTSTEKLRSSNSSPSQQRQQLPDLRLYDQPALSFPY